MGFKSLPVRGKLPIVFIPVRSIKDSANLEAGWLKHVTEAVLSVRKSQK